MLYQDQLPDLRYETLQDAMSLYVEYQAVCKFVANGDFTMMAKRYPELTERLSDLELDFALLDEGDFRVRAFEMLRTGMFNNNIAYFAMAAVYRFLDSEGNIVPEKGDEDEVIEAVKPVIAQSNITHTQLKKIRRNQQSIARENYQRKRLGDDGLVSKDLYAKARKAVALHLKKGGAREDISSIRDELASNEKLSDEKQLNTLLNEIMLPYFDKLHVKDTLVFRLLDEPNQQNKTILYFWLQLCRKYEIGKEFPMSRSQGLEMAKCSPADYPKYIKAMDEMGILKSVTGGIKGAKGKPAARYKLLVKAEF